VPPEGRPADGAPAAPADGDDIDLDALSRALGMLGGEDGG
jgi:hypothetical protein